MARKNVKYQIDDKEYSESSEIFNSLFGKALKKLLRKEKDEEPGDKYDKTRRATKKKAVSHVEEAQSGVTEVEKDAKNQKAGSRGPTDASKAGQPKTAGPRRTKNPSRETRERYSSPISYEKTQVSRFKTDAGPKKSIKTKRPSRKRPRKRSGRLRAALALVLLLVLGAALANMYGIVDFGKFSGSLKSIKEKDIPLVDDIGRLVRSLRSSIRGDSEPPAVHEAPAKTDQKSSGMARKMIEKRASGPPKPNKASSPGKQGVVAEAPKAVAAPQKEEVPSRPVGFVQKEETPAKVGTPVNEREISAEEGRLPTKPPVSYPYSIYLGSYQDLEGAEKSISRYRDTGLSPYWVKVDLGEKGVWFRIYAGYFQTRKEADIYISAKQIPEAKSRHTRYANLIGIYQSAEAIHGKKVALLKMGFSPYVIPGIDGDSLLYTGAFYQRVRAEKEHVALSSKGIQSRLVER